MRVSKRHAGHSESRDEIIIPTPTILRRSCTRTVAQKKKKNSESFNPYSAYDLNRALLVLFLMKLPPGRSCHVSPIPIVVLKIVAIA